MDAARRERLDRLLVARGLSESREKARALILAGRVFSAGRRLDKAGALVAADAALEITPSDPWVSRGALKLEDAFDRLGIVVAERATLDVGASTGGFTQVLLARGASRVVAVDVGRGQLDWRLRNDPRVQILDGKNARHLLPEDLPFLPAIAVVDVSFISLRLVLPAVIACLAPGGDVVALVKPQFEVGRGRVGRGGIVRDPALHREVLLDLARLADRSAWGCRAIVPSPIRGAEGNAEFFVHLRPGAPSLGGDALRSTVEAALARTPGDPA